VEKAASQMAEALGFGLNPAERSKHDKPDLK
jgi:hypothetical protein